MHNRYSFSAQLKDCPYVLRRKFWRQLKIVFFLPKAAQRMPRKLSKISAQYAQGFGGHYRKLIGGCIAPPPPLHGRGLIMVQLSEWLCLLVVPTKLASCMKIPSSWICLNLMCHQLICCQHNRRSWCLTSGTWWDLNGANKILRALTCQNKHKVFAGCIFGNISGAVIYTYLEKSSAIWCDECSGYAFDFALRWFCPFYLLGLWVGRGFGFHEWFRFSTTGLIQSSRLFCHILYRTSFFPSISSLWKRNLPMILYLFPLCGFCRCMDCIPCAPYAGHEMIRWWIVSFYCSHNKQVASCAVFYQWETVTSCPEEHYWRSAAV